VAAILITGFAGGLAQRTARLLLEKGREVVGVDYRPAPPLPGVTLYRASYNKTAIEDVFRRHSVESVLHLGRVGNLSEAMEKRFELNVVGTQKIMNLCLAHGVKSLVVLSTFHIYGAHPKNHRWPRSVDWMQKRLAARRSPLTARRDQRQNGRGARPFAPPRTGGASPSARCRAS